MRMFAIADRISSFGDVDRAVRHHLDVLSMKYTILLLSHHIRDSGLHCLEVISDLFHLVFLTALLHYRTTFDDSCGVLCATGIKSRCLEVILHVIGCQLEVSVCGGNISIIIDELLSVAEILDDGVFCCCECGCVEGTFLEHFKGVPAENRIRLGD